MPSSVEADAGARRLRVLLRRVPGRHVADLVAEHAGKLRLVVEVRQDAARDVDVSARQRERVDRRLIDDGKMPRKVGTLATRARGACPMSSTYRCSSASS